MQNDHGDSTKDYIRISSIQHQKQYLREGSGEELGAVPPGFWAVFRGVSGAESSE